MGVYIKGLKMPKNCDACPMLYEYRFCSLTDDHASSIEWKTEEKRMPNCPLIELPDHGDLIDRDEAAHEIWLIRCEECGLDGSVCESCDNKTAMKMVMDAPVIIPAERSEE